MKHTKNILKSLLITVMALSLLEVSCSKDEGGSKPTSPQTIVVNATTMTKTLEGIFALTVDDSESALFAKNTTLNPTKGKATVNTANTKKVDQIKDKLKTSIDTVAKNFASSVILTSNVDTLSNSSKDLTLTMKPANANVKFASDVTDGSKYTYDASTVEAKLVVTINEAL